MRKFIKNSYYSFYKWDKTFKIAYFCKRKQILARISFRKQIIVLKTFLSKGKCR